MATGSRRRIYDPSPLATRGPAGSGPVSARATPNGASSARTQAIEPATAALGGSALQSKYRKADPISLIALQFGKSDVTATEAMQITTDVRIDLDHCA